MPVGIQATTASGYKSLTTKNNNKHYINNEYQLQTKWQHFDKQKNLTKKLDNFWTTE